MDKGIRPIMNIITVIFLRLSKIAYTKFSAVPGITQFERYLMDLDILPIHGRIRHPQTQGKIERFHRTMKQEVLRQIPQNLLEADRLFQYWRWKYNEIRPHEALGHRPPASVYHPSSRALFEPRPYEYPVGAKLYRSTTGAICDLAVVFFYLSETMANTYLEIRAGDTDTFRVCYRNFQIAEIDANTVCALIATSKNCNPCPFPGVTYVTLDKSAAPSRHRPGRKCPEGGYEMRENEY